MAQAEEFNEIKTIEHPNMIIRVHIPFLTDEERRRRMKQCRRTAESLLKSRKEGA